jgi:4,5-dihydroxyphthalate decarboxylase
MHTVIIREDLLEQAPWLAMNVVQAFRRAKARAWRKMEDPRRVSLAWFREALEEQRGTLGPDPWPYDLPSNWKTLDALCEYAARGGLTRQRLRPDDLFFPASVDDPPQYVGA